MRFLLNLDRQQLARLEQAIVTLNALPPLQRERKLCLLHALETERQELIRCNPAIRMASRLKAAA